MESNIYRLFVYGSLRSGLLNPILSHITRYFVFDGMGSIQGNLYDMGEYPGALPCTEDHLIVGEVYHIANVDEFEKAMEVIDDYEGLIVEPGEIPLFRREPVHVLFRNTTVVAWMYWYNRAITNRPRIESGDFVAYKMGIGK